MSITKSYNNKTDTYYAYETKYEWNEEKQKKIQIRRCIGHFDPNTGEIIPNGKIGRPSISKTNTNITDNESKTNDEIQNRIVILAKKIKEIKSTLIRLSSEIDNLYKELSDISKNT